MTTFRLDESEGPGTHVFVVGVGAYPHLQGGTGKLTGQPLGMGQLTSPPVSAMEVLKWIDGQLKNPQAPLKSIEVLISQPVRATFTDKKGQTEEIDSATYDNFAQSAQIWYERASLHPENVVIFYFCGHGLGDGLNSQLLLEDYGKTNPPLRHAINFSGFRMSMGSTKATKQLYLIDACRVVDPTMLVDPYNMAGSGLPPGNVMTMGKGIANPVIFATRNGEQAFGPPGKVSHFTYALLQGLGRCGVYSPDSERWSVSPIHLTQAIAAQLEDFTKRPQCPSDGMPGTPFELHVLDQPPEVVVHISLNPSADHENAKILATCANAVHERDNRDHPWRTFLPMGQCNVEASFPAPSILKVKPKTLHLQPPFQEIILGVV